MGGGEGLSWIDYQQVRAFLPSSIILYALFVSQLFFFSSVSTANSDSHPYPCLHHRDLQLTGED